MAKFNTAAPLPTPENFAKSKREEKIKEARAIQLSRQRAAAYNMTLRALAIQASMKSKRNEEEDRKARQDARQKASNFRMNTTTLLKKGSPEEKQIRAVHAMLSKLAVGDNQDDDQLSTIPESARNSNSAKTVRSFGSNLHDEVAKEAEKQLNHQALVSFMQENYPDRMSEIPGLLKEFEGREDVLFEELTAKLNEELAADTIKRAEQERQELAERVQDGDEDAQADLDALEAAEKQESGKTAVEDLEEVAAEAAAAIINSGGHLGRSGSFLSHASFSEGSERHESMASKASSSSKRSSTSRRSSDSSRRSSESSRRSSESSRRSSSESSKRTSVSTSRTSVSSKRSSVSRKSSSKAAASMIDAETMSDSKSRASSKTSTKSFARSHSGRSVVKQSSSFMSLPRGSSTVGILDKGVELRQVIHSFYSVYSPEKLDGVDSVLEHFKGRERDLFATLELKYDVSFSADGSARPNHVTVPGIARGKSRSSSSRSSRMGSKSSTRKASSSSHKSRSSTTSKGGADDESIGGVSLPFVEAAPVVTSKFAVDVQSRVLGDRMKAKGQSEDKVKAIMDSSGPMM
jgi:hypothetical protein